MLAQKQNASNGKAKSSGTATPVSTADKRETADVLSAFAAGKPDKKAYDAEQDKIKAEIDALQVKLASPPLLHFPNTPNGFLQSAVKEKIALATKPASGSDRRNVLRAELEGIRGQQSTLKNSRGKVLDQLKTIQEGIQKKVTF